MTSSKGFLQQRVNVRNDKVIPIIDYPNMEVEEPSFNKGVFSNPD